MKYPAQRQARLWFWGVYLFGGCRRTCLQVSGKTWESDGTGRL